MSVRLPLDRGPATSTSPSGSNASAWISRDRPSCSAEMPRGRHQAEHAARARGDRGSSCSGRARDRRSRRSTRSPHRSAALRRRARASASAGALRRRSDREPARRRASGCRRRCESTDARRTTDTARTRLAPRRDGARARGGTPGRRAAAAPRTESGCASTARLATAAKVALAAETVTARQTPRRSTRLARAGAPAQRLAIRAAARRAVSPESPAAAAGAGDAPAGRRRSEHLQRHPILVGHLPPPDLDPDVVAAAGGHDGEMLARQLRNRRQLVLHRAELLERVLRLDRQQLVDDAVAASIVSPFVARSTCSVGVTMYGFSPTCSTSASPSSRTIAWSRDGTKLMAGGRASATVLHGSARTLSNDGAVAHGTCRPISQ